VAELPPEYRRKGPELVGIALFQADDHVAKPTPGAKEALASGVAPDASAFMASLVRAHGARHSQAVDLVDIIDGHFAAIWHANRRAHSRALISASCRSR
jgi:hypothetical protein